MMNHKKWLNWHNIASAFFLPLALLFIVTGALYTLGIHGETEELAIPFSGDMALYSDTEKLVDQLKRELPQEHHYLLERETRPLRNARIWGRFSSAHLIVAPNKDNSALEVTVNHPSLYQTLVLAHKGKVKTAFILFSVLFSIALLFSYLSGVVLAIRKRPKATLITISLGLLTTLVILIVSV